MNKRQIPKPFIDAVGNGSEEDAEALLELYFSVHHLIDDPEQEMCPWDQCTHFYRVQEWYRTDSIPPVIKALAPTLDDAKNLTLHWLETFPHICSVFEDWMFRRDELENPSAKNFIAELIGN